MSNPTNHPVSQAEAQPLHTLAGTLYEAARCLGVAQQKNDDKAAYYWKPIADRAEAALNRHIAQAGAPEGQAVAWQWRIRETDEGPGLWSNCDDSTAANLSQWPKYEIRALGVIAPHPIPRAEAAGVGPSRCGSHADTLKALRGDCNPEGDEWDAAICAALDHAIEILESPARVPDGWRLVPVEPTDRMIGAGIEAYNGKCEESYRAMLATSPAPPDEGGLRDRLQRQCSAWGTYWRAPDSHGVKLTAMQAVELLTDALGVEVEITVDLYEACETATRSDGGS